MRTPTSELELLAPSAVPAVGGGIHSPETAAAGGHQSRAAAPLALNKGIATPEVWPDPRPVGSCHRSREDLRLLNLATGELIYTRCKATNLCPECRVYAVRETIEMLLLDALEYPPVAMATLTAREFPKGPELRDTLRKVVLACRRRWEGFEWFVPRERHRSGQHHIHPLIKGVTEADFPELYDVITGVWCGRHDAVAYPFDLRADGPQGLKSVNEGQGLVRYLSKDLSHSLKSAQALEFGFRGHRTSQTRGYFPEGAAVMRERAKASLRHRALIWKIAADNPDLAAWEVQAQVEQLLNEPAPWVMYRVPLTDKEKSRA